MIHKLRRNQIFVEVSETRQLKESHVQCVSSSETITIEDEVRKHKEEVVEQNSMIQNDMSH